MTSFTDSILSQCPHMSNLSSSEREKMLDEFLAQKKEMSDQNAENITKREHCPFLSDQSENKDHSISKESLIQMCPYMIKQEYTQINPNEFKCAKCGDYLIHCMTCKPCEHAFCVDCVPQNDTCTV